VGYRSEVQTKNGREGPHNLAIAETRKMLERQVGRRRDRFDREPGQAAIARADWICMYASFPRWTSRCRCTRPSIADQPEAGAIVKPAIAPNRR